MSILQRSDIPHKLTGYPEYDSCNGTHAYVDKVSRGLLTEVN